MSIDNAYNTFFRNCRIIITKSHSHLYTIRITNTELARVDEGETSKLFLKCKYREQRSNPELPSIYQRNTRAPPSAIDVFSVHLTNQHLKLRTLMSTTADFLRFHWHLYNQLLKVKCAYNFQTLIYVEFHK